MTTLRQKLVRKKNRKLRRLRELYPAINIKLFYARDFRALMLKYGKARPGRTACRVRRARSPCRTAASPRTDDSRRDAGPPTTSRDRPLDPAAAARRPARRRPLSAPDPEGSAIQR